MSIKSFLTLVSVLFLTACAGPREYEGPYTSRTPTVGKFAKRAYNKPYTIKGTRYHPQKHYEYRAIGVASYYGGRDVFHGRKTSNGETFDMNGLTAAHKTLPIPSVIRVTNLKNGRSMKLKVNDRGPFIKGRILDVSMRAAKMLGFYKDGLARVKVETCMNDTLFLARSGGSHFDPQLTQVKIPSRKPLFKAARPTLLAQASRQESFKESRRESSRIPVPHQLPNRARLTPVHSSSKLATSGGTRGPLSAVHPQKGIFIQTAQMSSLEDAQNKASALLRKYPQVGVRVAPHHKGHYRVLLGPFRSSQDAKNLVTSLSGGNAGQ